MADETTERIKVQGNAMVEKIKQLIHEGNVRRILIKNDKGETVMEFPVTVGVIGAVAAPVVAAIGGIAALASEWTVEVQRKEPKQEAGSDTTGAGGGDSAS